MNTRKNKEFNNQLERWMLEKTIDLTKSCNNSDFEVFRKLKIPCKDSICSEFDIGILLCRMYQYYDFESLRNNEKLTCYEKKLLYNFTSDQLFWKELVKEGYMTDTVKQKSLIGTGVSTEEYKVTLAKLENIRKNSVK